MKPFPQVVAWGEGYGYPWDLVTRTRTLTSPQIVTNGLLEVSGPGVGYDKILRGRNPSPTATDEATISFAAEAPDMTIGSTVIVKMGSDAGPEKTITVPVRIVGIHANPGEFQSLSGPSFPGLSLGPGVIVAHLAHLRSLTQSDVLSVAFKLRRGAADVPAFRAEAARQHITVDLPLETAE